jgi:glucokinase
MTDGDDKGGGLYLGVEIGGTKLQVCAGDGRGKIVERTRLEVDSSAGAGGIRSQIERAISELTLRFKPIATGVGYGGPIDWRTGKVCCSHQVKGWSDFPLAEWLSELSRGPVYADNDANVAALGEARHGAGAGFDTVFYVTLGSGVGGGFVMDGKIYHGAPPGESEIGHVRLDRAGTTVESRCSGWAVDGKLRAAKAKHPQSALAQRIGEAARGEAKLLEAAFWQEDPLARAILGETAEDLAFGLSHVVHLLHPRTIVLGGGLALIGEPLRAAVELALRRFIMEAFAPGPEVALTRLKEDAVPVGALELARLAFLAP